jgi:carboxymethylenebutenolidase
MTSDGGSVRAEVTRMSVETVEIPTAKGPCSFELVKPEGAGLFPVLIFVPDAGGQRPTMTEMAERMSLPGFLVAIYDPFFRSGSPWDLLPPGPRTLDRFMEVWQDDALRQRFMKDYYGVATSAETIAVGVGALFPYLDGRADVKKGKVGITGYCMGGNVAMRAGIAFPDRIGAIASFHGGGLVTDQPDSVVKQVGAIQGEVLVAGAIEDQSFTDEMKEKLEHALTEAKVRHTIETYPAHHGFAVHDHKAAYDAAAAERHYQELDALLKRAIA